MLKRKDLYGIEGVEKCSNSKGTYTSVIKEVLEEGTDNSCL
jgi:hypothetical protein